MTSASKKRNVRERAMNAKVILLTTVPKCATPSYFLPTRREFKHKTSHNLQTQIHTRKYTFDIQRKKNNCPKNHTALLANYARRQVMRARVCAPFYVSMSMVNVLHMRQVQEMRIRGLTLCLIGMRA